MKSALFSALNVALATASALPLDGNVVEKRQLGSLVTSLMGQGKAPTILKKLTPEYDPKATRAVYMYGPYTLPPSSDKHGKTGFGSSGIKLDPNSDTPGGTIAPPCKDCTVLKAVANFAFKNGTLADTAHGIYEHHIIIVDLGGKAQLMMPVDPPKCKNGAKISSLPPMGGMGGSSPAKGAAGGMAGMSHSRSKRAEAAGPSLSVFVGGGGSVGSGNPFAPKGGSVKSGYWIGPSGPMRLTSEIINYDKVAKEIYLTLDVEWIPGKASDLLDVGMGAISADRCDDKEKGIVHPPKDKAVTYKGEEWIVSTDGYFVNFQPHIHDGGVKVNVFINNKQVCESKAIYGDEVKGLDGKGWATITGYTPCNDAIAIKKGDKVMVTSEYDLTAHRLRPDNQHADGEAEGMVLVNFIWAKPFAKK